MATMYCRRLAITWVAFLANNFAIEGFRVSATRASTRAQLARQDRSSAHVAGPWFSQDKFPPFLNGFSNVEEGCATSLEATFLMDKAEISAENFASYFQPAFVFEGENVKCLGEYETHDFTAEECRKTCAGDDGCTAFVVIEGAKGKSHCGPCILYKTNSCAKEFQKKTSCSKIKGSFIGAYSKTNDFESGLALEDKQGQTGFKLQKGLKLIHIDNYPLGELFDNDRSRSRENLLDKIRSAKDTTATLGFEAGVDFRSCWGDLEDLEGNKVCGEAAMKKLYDSISNVAKKPKQDSAGQSGSTLIPNYDNFIIKNAMDDPEFQLLRTTMPKFKRDIESRPQGCFSSALAPICSVMIEGNAPKGPAKWLLMRKIEIPGAESLSFSSSYSHWYNFNSEAHPVNWFDVKGPYFATGAMDGKTQFQQWGWIKLDGDEEGTTWKKKDAGFVNIFPNGLQLEAVGSRDAGATISFDTLMLTEAVMTDYSLFGQFYKKPIPENVKPCGASGAPKFPLVVEVKYDGIPEKSFPLSRPQNFYMAFGIIDYIEQRVNRDVIGSRFSTMKESWEYREYFMRMWPEYFKTPKIGFKATSPQAGTIFSDHKGTSEEIAVGMRVMAIEEIKWKNTKRTLQASRSVNYKYYYEQIPPVASATSRSSGSTYKVLPGAMGRLISIVTDQKEKGMLGGKRDAVVAIEWDPDTGVGKKVIKPSKDGTEKAFMVAVEQIWMWHGH